MKKSLILIVLSAALTAMAGTIAPDVDDLLGVGDIAPGAPTNSIRIRSFGTPSGWQNGFMVNITGSDGIIRVTHVTDLPGSRLATVLIKSGDLVPGTRDLTIKRFMDPVPDATGAAAIRAVIKRFTATNMLDYINSTNDVVLLLVSPFQPTRAIIRESDGIPGMSGYILATFRSVAMRRQDIHFVVTAFNPGTGDRIPALLKYDHNTQTIRTLAYEGQLRTYRNGPVVVEGLTVSSVAASTGDGQSGGEYYSSNTLNESPAATANISPSEDTAFSLPIMSLRPLPTHPDFGINPRFRVLALEK